jgi:hypothetical protein
VTDLTIESILHELASAMTGVTSATSGASRTWGLDDRPFAILAAGVIELRLDPAVAAAASRTPDASASSRGPEWVRFEPATLEGHDLDRLVAWFGLAHKRAATGAVPTSPR